MNAQQAPTILAFIKPRAVARRGWAEATVADIAAATGIDLHDVTKVLRQWNKHGLVKFTEHKNGTATRISGIRLTATGMALDYSGRDPGDGIAPYLDPDAVAQDLLATSRIYAHPPQEELNVAIGANPSSAGGKAGVSSLRARFRQQVLDEGIPEGTAEFEHRYGTIRHKHYADLAVKGAATKAKKRAAERDELSHGAASVNAEAETALPLITKDNRVTPSLIADLPLIKTLGGKEDRLLSAAASIAADFPDLAEQMMARAETAYTPLEREVLTLLKRLGEA